MRQESNVNGKTLVYEENFWTGKRKLFYDGAELKRINNKKFALNDENPDAAEFAVSGNLFKGVTVDSELFSSPVCVRRALTVLEYILIILPILPSVFFGLVGGAIGGLFTALSLWVVPKIKPLWLKIVIALELCAVGGFTAFWAAFGVALLML